MGFTSSGKIAYHYLINIAIVPLFFASLSGNPEICFKACFANVLYSFSIFYFSVLQLGILYLQSFVFSKLVFLLLNTSNKSLILFQILHFSV